MRGHLSHPSRNFSRLPSSRNLWIRLILSPSLNIGAAFPQWVQEALRASGQDSKFAMFTQAITEEFAPFRLPRARISGSLGTLRDTQRLMNSVSLRRRIEKRKTAK